MNSTKVSKRILALDILRGVTIAGMIMVNNPGSWGHIYAPLRHAEWNGLTPTDLVFPFFMFIMGISTYISLKKYNFEFSHTTGMKILKRTIVIFLIGMAIGWFSRFCYYWASAPDDLSFGEKLWASVWTFDRIRILGVMQRLALCYGAASIIALTMKHKHIPYLIASLLIGYFILLMCGNGFAYNETNILSVVDRAILTPAHMYKDNGIDPEGLLSTIPAIAHVLLGFCVGRLMLDGNKSENRASFLNSQLITLFLVGVILTFSGFLLNYGLLRCLLPFLGSLKPENLLSQPIKLLLFHWKLLIARQAHVSFLKLLLLLLQSLLQQFLLRLPELFLLNLISLHLFSDLPSFLLKLCNLPSIARLLQKLHALFQRRCCPLIIFNIACILFCMTEPCMQAVIYQHFQLPLSKIAAPFPCSTVNMK